MPLLKVTDKRDYYRKHYLRSEHWKLVKSLVLSRFPGCQVCGSKSSLDVHHRHYRNLFDVRTDDLVVLCRRHHTEIHAPDNLRKPSEEVVEKRLNRLLPLSAGTPRERYLRLARRFFAAASALQEKSGIQLKGKARKLIWGSELREIGERPSITDLVFSEKPINVKLRNLADRQRYTLVAIRLFQIARKIRRVYGLDFVGSARKRIFGQQKPRLTSSFRRVNDNVAGLV